MGATQANPDPSAPPPEGVLDRALALVEFLRAHCPWDAEQTPTSLLRHLVEETHEVVDAIVRDDEIALRDELGDLLLNLAFQVVLGEERGALDRIAVVEHLEEKMRRRHPHLYGLGEAEPWRVIKERELAEKGAGSPSSLLGDVPAGFDPLLRAHRLQERVARVGFDWPDALGAWEKVREEMDEVRAEMDAGSSDALHAEIGDLLFSVVNLARHAGVHAPGALARTNAKFQRRFTALEQLALERGERIEQLTLADMDHLWDEVKHRERRAEGNLPPDHG
ncbi:MAG: nucleoside triphosphate pyrophosphohydrolase [Gemmatimonadetes bacterium]|nr:nucleoside triphosphate pyrophosphohydrolase [Gemmatimonadota bacterium]